MDKSRASQPASAKKSSGKKKVFVLDTNVLIYDPSSLYRFKDNDVYIPMVTLEELDGNKKGSSDAARSCRQASRLIEETVSREQSGDIKNGFELSHHNGGQAIGRLFLQTNHVEASLPPGMPSHKGDNEILRVALGLQASHGEKGARVVLVSKDINLRIKAKALQVDAEDYFNDNVVEDADFLYTGMLEIGEDFWRDNAIIDSGQRDAVSFFVIQGPTCETLLPNMVLHGEGNGKPFCARVESVHGDRARLETITEHTHQKNSVWGITAKNTEQSVALNLLMDDNVDLVTILGQAGTGKTLLTLAASLELMLHQKRYKEMIFTRITVPVGEDIGFLPGTEEEKMMPWMGALEDNLEALVKSEEASGSWGKGATRDLLGSKIKVKAMSFMRGRTFMDKILVVDEAQNLTPKQMKTLITRAGKGTKVVCLGNVAQIDAAYLTESSCGLSYLIERMKGWDHYGHVTLAKVERSRLADQAAARL
jgi:PhoH-like ATPase